MKKVSVVFALLFAGILLPAAENSGEIRLPKPDLKSGKPFMQCVAERRTERRFSTKPLSQQMIETTGLRLLFRLNGNYLRPRTK